MSFSVHERIQGSVYYVIITEKHLQIKGFFFLHHTHEEIIYTKIHLNIVYLYLLIIAKF